MQEKSRDILTTIALPYANGPLHLGHMVEAIQADIWVRFQRAVGHTCRFLSGSDAHGTAVMLSAEQQGVSPEQRVSDISTEHQADFEQFRISFDHFHTTHSAENQHLSAEIYQALKSRGDIKVRTITQAYDEEKGLFLSDRYIKGSCPRCEAPDQYGDNCEQCGATYSPMDLIDPVSVLSNQPPIEKESEHYFFGLNSYRDFLLGYIESGSCQPSVANKLKEWFSDTLKDWDISRDAPYFGFEIPGAENKFFYVWLDAPIGYIAATQHWADQQEGVDWKSYWQADSTAELHHFIGKDIVYFHALFWPAILKGSGYRLPTRVNVHGYLTVNGEKMSKSRGTFIKASDYLNTLPADCLRYYYAAKLNSDVEDIDLNMDDFMARVNSDLVGKFVNLASRCAKFINKNFDGMLASALDDPALYDDMCAEAKNIQALYDALEFNKAMRLIMGLVDRANQYIDQHQPWKLIKQEGCEERVQAVCSQGLNMFRLAAIYLSPVLVETSEKIAAFCQADLHWSGINNPLVDHRIAKFKPLLQRVTSDHLAALTSS
jgi:methionyl-tRNA synthetase